MESDPYDIRPNDNGCDFTNQHREREIIAPRRKQAQQHMEEVYSSVFTLASIVGLHILIRNTDGTYRLSLKRILARVVAFTIALGVCCMAIIIVYRFQWGIYLLLITLPYWYNTIFCLGCYFGISRNPCQWKRYFQQMHILRATPNTFVNIRIVWIISFSFTTSCIALYELPHEWYYFTIPCLIVGIVPSVVDIYMGMLTYTIKDCHVHLVNRVKNCSKMTLKNVDHLALEWFFLRDILIMHNEVSNE